MKSKPSVPLRSSEYVGPRTSRAIAGLLLLAGVVWAVGGVAYAINGATQAPASVTVPVSIEAQGEVANGSPERPTAVTVDDVVLPDGARLQAAEGGLQLVTATGQASRWTGFLARGDTALLGLGFGACALLLAPSSTRSPPATPSGGATPPGSGGPGRSWGSSASSRRPCRTSPRSR